MVVRKVWSCATPLGVAGYSRHLSPAPQATLFDVRCAFVFKWRPHPATPSGFFPGSTAGLIPAGHREENIFSRRDGIGSETEH